MKVKRRLMAIMLVTILVLSMGIVANAAKNTTVYSNMYDVEIYGYVDYEPGFWILVNDQYSWNCGLYGEYAYQIAPDCDSSKVTIYTSKWSKIKEIYLSDSHRYSNGSVKSDKDSNAAKMVIKLYEKSETITDK